MRRQTIFLGAGILAGATLLGGAASRRNDVDRPLTEYTNEYAELITTAGEWSAENTGPDKLVYASIRGMLSRLDPHTTFLDPDEFSSMEEKQRGSFYGLGISIQKRQGHVTVISPIEGTPAWKKGLRAGDIITRINGEPIDDWTSDEVVRHLKGPKGTQVTITIRRAGLSEPIEMTITRAEIPTNSVRYAFLLTPDTGYIHLAEFTHTSDREMVAAIERLEKQGMKKLLFDLRGNPGGVLDQAVDVADLFLKKKEKIVYTQGPHGVLGAGLLCPRQRAAFRRPARSPRQPRLRVGVGDRRRRDPGPRPGPDRRNDDLGQGPRPGSLPPSLRRGPRSHDGEVLHALRAMDPARLHELL